MIYSDEENKRWWRGLSKIERHELIEKIRESAESRMIQQIAESARRLISTGVDPSPSQIGALRKWA